MTLAPTTAGAHPSVAVLVPCFNEEATVAKVVEDFRRALPGAAIHVFDNNSTDRTVEEAARAGALVRAVRLQGKGNVVRQMFADVDADVYVMVDGDGTYDAGQSGELVEQLLANGCDMVVGMRQADDPRAYRSGHRFGNGLLTRSMTTVFGRTFADMLSGYRVFSRRYVKSFPAHSAGFEIETELTVHALELRMPVLEVPTAYSARPEGSSSKLRTYRDGLRILWTIVTLFKAERPLAFFSIAFAACAAASVALAVPLFETYLATGLVPRLPTAVLSVGLMLFGTILLACGLVLDTVTRGRLEAKRLAYLSLPGPARGSPARS